jgi:hypothetical protein
VKYRYDKTHQYMEKLRGATPPVYGNVEGCNITSIWKRLRVQHHQYMETLRGATSPVYGNVEGCNITSI